MSSSAGAATRARFCWPGPLLRTRSSAPICPSEIALLLPLVVEAGSGRRDRVQVAPGLAQQHGRHLGEPQGFPDPPSLRGDALEAEADEGAREALLGADVAAGELEHRPQPDAVEALHVLAEPAAVVHLAALVVEPSDRALQLEAVDH